MGLSHQSRTRYIGGEGGRKGQWGLSHQSRTRYTGGEGGRKGGTVGAVTPVKNQVHWPGGRKEWRDSGGCHTSQEPGTLAGRQEGREGQWERVAFVLVKVYCVSLFSHSICATLIRK